MEGYCLKCKYKRQMKNIKEVKKNGRKFAIGVCSKCGTKMSKIL